MPRAPKNQRTIDDLVIEDPELDECLHDVTQNELAALTYRGSRKRAKDIISEKHPAAINAKTADGRDRWIVVGQHRFLYRNAERAAGKNPPRAGLNTKIDIQRIVEVEG